MLAWPSQNKKGRKPGSSLFAGKVLSVGLAVSTTSETPSAKETAEAASVRETATLVVGGTYAAVDCRSENRREGAGVGDGGDPFRL